METSTFDELYAIGEMNLFLEKAINHCKAKIRTVKFAGMEIEDVAQEAAIKVLRSLDNYNAETSKLSTYVDHVIDNMIRDCLRYVGTQKNLMVVNADDLFFNPTLDISTKQDDVGDYYTNKFGVIDAGYQNVEDIIDVTEHMGLNEREKEVFLLRMEGYEFTEIAKFIGVSKSRLSQIWSNVKDKCASMD